MPPTVKLVGVLTLLHGVVLAVVGALLVVMSPFQLMSGEELGVVVFVAILGAVWAVAGAVQAGCGIQVLRRRWRVPALAVNLGVLVATLPMCCALSVGLGVLSTVLLSQPEAARWFEGPEV